MASIFPAVFGLSMDRIDDCVWRWSVWDSRLQMYARRRHAVSTQFLYGTLSSNLKPETNEEMLISTLAALGLSLADLGTKSDSH